MNHVQYGFEGRIQLDSASEQFFARSMDPSRSNDSLARDRIELNARAFSGNFDNSPTQKGYMLARQLEQIMQEVLKTPRPRQSALDVFAVDNRLNEGAEVFTVRRTEDYGSAGYYDGAGQNMPTTGITQDEESWPVHHIVSSYELSFFDEKAAAFSGVSIENELRDATEYAINEFQNRKAWEGDEQRQALGVLNQTYVPRTNFGLTIGDSQDGEAIAQEILRLGRFTASVTENVFSPSRILTSVRLANYLSETELGTFKEKSIAERVLQKSNYIQDIVGVPELGGVGPNGEDVMLYDAGKDRIRGYSHAIAKPLTFLPVQRYALKKVIPAYMSYGGIRTDMPLNSLIAYCTLEEGVKGIY